MLSHVLLSLESTDLFPTTHRDTISVTLTGKVWGVDLCKETDTVQYVPASFSFVSYDLQNKNVLFESLNNT